MSENEKEIEKVSEDIFFIIQCHSISGKFKPRYPFKLNKHPILREIAKYVINFHETRDK